MVANFTVAKSSADTVAASEKKDVATRITERICALLERGVVPWRKTWAQNLIQNRPRSAGTGQEYHGINALHLSAVMFDMDYISPTFITFREAKKRGGMVRKGEHGYPVVYWKIIEVDDRVKKAAGEDGKKKLPMLRYSTVFNVGQCDGLASVVEPTPPAPATFQPIETAKTIWQCYPGAPTLTHGSDKAAYSPGLDRIIMPSPDSFESSQAYYATLFHEAIHSTGHESRLGRDMTGHFGTKKYGREELVAEMGAAMLCAYAGIEDATIDNSAAYLQSWLKTIKADKRLLITAAGQADRAVNYIRNVRQEEPAPDDWQDSEE